jgi:hypothetical protein
MSSIYASLQIGGEAAQSEEEQQRGVQDLSPTRIYANGEMVSMPGVQHNTAHDIHVGSVRSPAGAARTAQSARDDDIVRVNVDGYVTDVRYGTARDNGWLPKDTTSEPEDTPAASEQQEEQQAQPPADPAAEAKAALEAAFPLTVMGRDRAMARVLNDVLTTGQVDSAFVRDMGANLEEVQSKVGAVAARLQEHQAAALDALNVDATHLRQWAA